MFHLYNIFQFVIYCFYNSLFSKHRKLSWSLVIHLSHCKASATWSQRTLSSLNNTHEYLMDVHPPVLANSQRRAVHKTYARAFPQAALFYERCLGDSHLFFKFYKTVIWDGIREYRRYKTFFPIKLFQAAIAWIVKQYYAQHDFGLWQDWVSVIMPFSFRFSVYFSIMASKNLQKSSAKQNNSLTLSLENIAIFICYTS